MLSDGGDLVRTSDEICVSLILLLAAVPSAFADGSDCTIKGDGNGDCRIGSDDFARFAACMTGPSGPADLRCVCYDASDDGDVDLGDFAYFQAAFSGPDVIPGCDLTTTPFEPGTLHVPPAAAALEDAALPEEYVENFREPRGVYGFAGEFCHVAIDLRIAGRGIDFVWARKYRSRVGPDSAQGVGWDYSYNVYLEQDGPDLILHDGFTRHDRYYAVSAPAGTYWCAPEFFREITQQPDGSYVCRFAHGGEWRFHAFDGSPRAGRLAAIADTNGNALTFGYDAAGRLTTITDTLGRNIAVTYTPNGRIAAVTDFIGRQVQYEYYTAPDPDGSVGDLKSVTSPAVTGTPNANDFPLGKTVTYTYTTGESNEALNHNLLTITDAKGQTYLVNEYAATADPNALDFDRLTRQTLGEPGDVIDYVYVPESPDAGNGYAVLRTIVNDRNGHVDEYLYDRFNRCVSVREYVGQADPNQPTTDVANRPVGKLRAGDPDFFEFRFEYNDDALPARLTLAEQNEIVLVYESDVDFLAPPRKRANLLSVERNPGPRGGDQPIIIEQFEYDELSNFDTNRVTRAVDGRGNQTLYEYDAAGNVTRVTHRLPSIVEDFEYNAFGQVTARVWPDNGGGHRRRDEFTYYASGVQAGYLESTVIDATGLALTTTFEYDAVGNVTRVIDPRGADRLLTVNQLNQVVRVASRQPGAANPDRYERDYYYDENDNVVRVDVQNRDENGALLANAYVSTLFEYDILDRCTRVTAEVDPGHDVIFAHEYDAEGNRTLLRSGEASNGNQPNNTVRFLYDERDLVYQVIRAQTDADQSTTQFDYDGNGNLIRATRGLEAGAAGAAPRVYDYTYDGYDRLISWADPMGNASSCTYDANGNRATRRNDGELVDVPGGGGNITLSEETYTYDAMDRLVRVDAAHVAYPATPVGDGLRTTLL
ncbi:MAG: RHS repeat protein, partial [Planctomycetota bacterium]